MQMLIKHTGDFPINLQGADNGRASETHAAWKVTLCSDAALSPRKKVMVVLEDGTSYYCYIDAASQT